MDSINLRQDRMTTDREAQEESEQEWEENNERSSVDEDDNTQTTTVANQDEEKPNTDIVKLYEATVDPTQNYGKDPRNPKHRSLNSRYCVAVHCPYHWQEQHEQGWCFSPECRRLWSRCYNDMCPYHLWDKRQHHMFPGRGEDWHRQLLLAQCRCDKICEIRNWPYCFNVYCVKHDVEKFMSGFLKDEGATVVCSITNHLVRQSGKD